MGDATSVVLIRLQVLHCRLANETKEVGALLPTSYTFRQPCPWEKTAPDRGCVNCRFVAFDELGVKYGPEQLAELLGRSSARQDLVASGWEAG